MPQEFLERMKKLLKDEYPLFLESYKKNPTSAIHINTSKISVSAFRDLSLFPIVPLPFLDYAFTHNQEKIGNHISHHLGLFYSQEPSAMVPVSSLLIQKNWKVLDLCASPGGKTSQLACKVLDGFVVSNEVNYNRAKKLLSNIERMGYSNVIVTSEDVKDLKKVYPQYFDLVLVDAPCSGEGMFRKDVMAQKEWSMNKVNELSHIQLHLLKEASHMVRKDGYLIYSTCTFSLEENEEIIQSFLVDSDFELIPVLDSILPVTKQGFLSECRRCYPYIMGEGQFVAVLRKKTGMVGEVQNLLEDLDLREKQIVESFLNENLKYCDLIIKKYKNKIIVIPSDSFEVPNLSCLSCFVTVGEIVKDRLIPHHQFIKAYGHLFCNQYILPFGDDTVLSYLKGRELNVSLPKGYGVIMVDQYPLGLFKSTGSVLKNHYPKGLRLKD